MNSKLIEYFKYLIFGSVGLAIVIFLFGLFCYYEAKPLNDKTNSFLSSIEDITIIRQDLVNDYTKYIYWCSGNSSTTYLTIIDEHSEYPVTQQINLIEN